MDFNEHLNEISTGSVDIHLHDIKVESKEYPGNDIPNMVKQNNIDRAEKYQIEKSSICRHKRRYRSDKERERRNASMRNESLTQEQIEHRKVRRRLAARLISEQRIAKQKEKLAKITEETRGIRKTITKEERDRCNAARRVSALNQEQLEHIRQLRRFKASKMTPEQREKRKKWRQAHKLTEEQREARRLYSRNYRAAKKTTKKA